ncbi:MAG: hypothetical protein JWQ81_6283 [Amycolatopsis sp.]|jgi:C-terminal processing protease CtpA/Prc|uniref:S41 family peptidase n=1 Tax=Amycolatopsis sp. TaxID=37632 RepID=UPI0026048F75|nr:S41 family peptidase [Amycolatopsis sp.]MCU1685544.1 hypothetical protein [Amycolatopsis sp.]
MTERVGQIDEVCRRLETMYVFPDVAGQLAKLLRARVADGAYDGLDDEELAAVVTEDLQSVNGDKHLRLRYHLEPVHDGGDGSFDIEAYRAEAELSGYGIARVERLPGNVGYLDTRWLPFSEVSGPAISAAMSLLAPTDALVIDVRQNDGGQSATSALISSYLFDEAKHLNDVYFREGDRTQQFWTSQYVPGRKFGGTKPVWALIGPDTFSGGEDLSYSLQQSKRAKTVGEPTRGGANPRRQYKIATHLDVTVSHARAINPVSGGNWEGCGVQPDIAVPAAEAFTTAYQLALEQVLTLGDSGARRPVADEARLALSEF